MINNTDSEIANRIEKSITQNKELEFLKEYRFPIKTKFGQIAYFTINSSKNERIFVFKIEGVKIALLKFEINNGNIIIKGIQGLKQTQIKTPSNWYQKLLDPFIASALKIYKDPKLLSEKLIYADLKNINSEILNKKLLEVTTKKLIKANANKTLIEGNRKEIELLEKLIRTVKIIRDKYFTENGKLNLKRERVKKIILSYAEHVKNKEAKQKRFKRIIKKRKDNFKRKIR